MFKAPGIVGFEADGFLVLGDGGGVLTLVVEHSTQIIVRFGVVGGEADEDDGTIRAPRRTLC